MVLLEVGPECMSGVEFKSDAPRSINMNRVAGRNQTLQAVEIKSRKIHLFRTGYDVQTIKPKQNSAMQLGTDFTGAAFRP
jgi:hypothetical protein